MADLVAALLRFSELRGRGVDISASVPPPLPAPLMIPGNVDPQASSCLLQARIPPTHPPTRTYTHHPRTTPTTRTHAR